MNSKFNFIILSGGYGTSFRDLYPNSHKYLIPINNIPVICIILENLLYLSEYIENIYILCFSKYINSYHKEISRRFYNNYKIKIINIHDNEGTAKSLQEFFLNNTLNNDNLCIMNSNIPLISKFTLQDFLIDTNNTQVLILASNLKKNILDYEKITDNLLIESHKNVNYIDFKYIFCNLIFIKTYILLEYLYKIEKNNYTLEYEYYDIFKLLNPNYLKLFIINSYIANKECILLKNHEDKDYIQEIHLENKNAAFITQSYHFIKKFESIENRLAFIEKKINQ
jgi:bifunctional N-acetylglucosamine-1-phosphate-uridyltransferase/glucosamine-1-phosphate-acetyltransferase GlmU-like protein